MAVTPSPGSTQSATLIWWWWLFVIIIIIVIRNHYYTLYLLFSWPVRKSSPIDSSIRLTFYRLSIGPTFDLIHFNQLPFSNQNCVENMLQTNQSNMLCLIRFAVLLISWLQGHTELSTALDIVPKQAYSETDQIIFCLHCILITLTGVKVKIILKITL